jgi:hypothetical protein
MANTIYEVKNINTLDGTEIEISSLKIKYLRQCMSAFEAIKQSKNDFESIDILVECARISLKQFYPSLSLNKQLVEDNFDLPTIYEILRVGAGIDVNAKSENTVKDQALESGTSWKDLDLVKLESEAFLLGIWKDYNELEESISMPELSAILVSKRESDYEEKKFLAAIQGVDLDKANNKQQEDPWTKLKNKVFNQGRQENDILTFKGDKAKRAGFGIGMGLDYEDLTKKDTPA